MVWIGWSVYNKRSDMMGTEIEYAWKEGSRDTIEAEVVVVELEKIREKHGRLDAEVIVAEARSKKSPLHEIFEWNDSIAAKKYREEQARLLCRSVVVIKNDIVIGNALIAIDVGEPLKDYVPASLLRTMPDERLRALEDVRAALKGLHKRYKYLSELDSVWEAIEIELA